MLHFHAVKAIKQADQNLSRKVFPLSHLAQIRLRLD
jgi:hypothetical protein